MKKRIFITGATGLIGKSLTEKLCKEGAYVKMLTGNIQIAKQEFKNYYTIEFYDRDKNNDPILVSKLIDESDVVINLAGASIGGKRWTAEYKDLLYSSRIKTTKMLVDSIRLCKNKPACLINISGVGVYGSQNNEILDESSPAGDDFLSELCKDWESEALKAEMYNVRTVIMRTGIVLSKDALSLEKLLTSNKFFISSYQGSGKQWISWIHISDLINLFGLVIENESVSGYLNATSPEPVTNKDFSKALSGFRKTIITLPVPGFILKLIAGEFAEYLLTGQRVVPAKALKEGFRFEFPELKSALGDILN